PDPALIKALVRAHQWRGMLESGVAKSIVDLARKLHHNERYARQIVRLAFLAPHIVEAILDGRQPRRVTVTRLFATELPLSWRQQRKLLGFSATA
ncbi:MAG TPA: hypothetical protein VJN41_01580, partial [Alphaproteobacteria bacterium]|nr:hypothetical protein [Alphaproteobacteria bacterium]